MTVRTPSQNDIIVAANRLRSTQEPLTRKHLDRAVCILRRRGDKKDLALLTRGGYSTYDYEHRPKAEKRTRAVRTSRWRTA